MELIQYIRLFRRWAWLLLLAAFIGGSISFITRSSATPEYRSEVKVAIGSFLQSPNPDSGEIRLGQDLAQTYAEIVRTHDLLQSTIDALNLPLSPGGLRSTITTRIVPNTSLLVIAVTYTDPVLAADIANELARQLILESPTNLTTEQQAQIDIANDQIEAIRTELDGLRLQLSAINEQISDTGDAETIDRLSEQRNTLIDQINQSSANIASFSSSIASLQQRRNSLEIVEQARVSGAVVGTSTLNATLLGAMVGLALAGGGVLLIEYLNDTFRTADEVVQTLQTPVIGVISRHGKKKDSYHKKLITSDLFSRIPEEYRTLRTNLLFAGGTNSKRPYIITSASPEEGKTVTAANLAISMALADMRVLLIDADMRRPKLQQVFGLSNELGLSTLLTNPPQAQNGSSAHTDFELNTQSWMQCIQDSGVPNLQVITSGFMPKNPAEMLGSTYMTRWVDIFHRALQPDVIIFDTPPCLVVSDSMVLAGAVDAQVVMVVEATKTRRNAAARAKERFTNINMEIVGIVLNGTNMRDEDYYGYYTYYYQSSESKKSGKVGQKA
ncbi:MAG: polysaccharide biosynthesis tyrosine autokinase [Phototrophicaceae bacterium]